MHLFDLPMEVLLKILTIHEYILRVPTHIGIQLINQLPSRKRCKFVIEGLTWRDYYDDGVTEFAKKYSPFVYVIFQLDIEAKYYDKSILLSFEDVKWWEGRALPIQLCGYPRNIDVFARAYKYLKIWTGDFAQAQYLWFPNVAIVQERIFWDDTALFEMPRKVKISTNQLCELGVMNKHHGRAIELQTKLFEPLKSISLNLSVITYLELVGIAKSSMQGCLRPWWLYIKFKFASQVNGEEQGCNVHPCHKGFPINWITDYFDLSKLCSFSLDYFAPATTIDFPGDFMRTLWNINCLSISVWELDVSKLPVLSGAFWDGYTKQFIQIEIARDHKLKFRIHRGMWNVLDERDRVTFTNVGGTRIQPRLYS